MANDFLTETQIKHLQQKMLDLELYERIADVFKILGDPTRMRILWALVQEELCVQDIARVLEMSQSAISHQLKALKQARLVKNRRDGKVVYYSLDDDHVKMIVNLALEHLNEDVSMA